MAMLNTNRSFNEEIVPGMEAPGMIRRYHEPEPHRRPMPPVPPHMRRQMVQLELDDKDMAVFQDVFGDEDTAGAAADILGCAPPEIQVLALQILRMIEMEVI